MAGLLMMLGILGGSQAPLDRLAIDDAGLTRSAPGLREHVAWGDVERVRIVTTDRGPWMEDVLFVIEAKGGEGCVVGQDLAVRVLTIWEANGGMPGGMSPAP